MERHTVIGDEMLAPVEFPWDIRPMVRSHHERWDGGGYPDGLAGEAIPFSARILRVADVFDALTTARSYRRRLTPEEALALMEGDEGSFDPRSSRLPRALPRALPHRPGGFFRRRLTLLSGHRRTSRRAGSAATARPRVRSSAPPRRRSCCWGSRRRR
jgi:hypothetical protein